MHVRVCVLLMCRLEACVIDENANSAGYLTSLQLLLIVGG